MGTPPSTAALHLLDEQRLRRFVARTAGVPVERISVRQQSLGGGLDSRAVVRVDARIANGGRGRPFRFVVKVLHGESRREATVYDELLAHQEVALAPRLLGTEQVGDADTWLCLERVVPWRRWPWPDARLSARLLDQLAQAHAGWPLRPSVRDWRYDEALQDSARSTLDLFESARGGERPMHGRSLQRVVEALPRVRRQLAAEDRPTVLHGDVHPGNALVRVSRGQPQVVLVDWGRARVGSPLEDVSSWLQSLAYWEPEARRRHDWLLRRYLGARGLPVTLTRSLRDHYWLAAASNALAGALRYHLAVAGDVSRTPPERGAAARAVRDWMRIVRRADACWRSAPAA